MPGIIAITQITPVTPVATAFGCSITGSGYFTRPAADQFLPVPVSDEITALTCPGLREGQFYRFGGHKMYMHLPPSEYAVFVELLAMALGYPPVPTNATPAEAGLVPNFSYAFSCMMDKQVGDATYALIAHCQAQLVFHGSRLHALCAELSDLMSDLYTGRLRFANNSWFHNKLERHHAAALHAKDNNGVLMLVQ